MNYLLKPDYIYLNGKTTSGKYVEVTGARITNICENVTGGKSENASGGEIGGKSENAFGGEVGNASGEPQIINLSGLTLLPGFIDIHVHGGGGYDTMDLSAQSLEKISLYKLEEGVTSFCPTTVTAPFEKLKKAASVVGEAAKGENTGAKIIGSFIEGPYINPKFKGAHPEEFIREINLDEIKELIDAGKGFVKSFAIAPELDGAAEAVKYLTQNGINVRMGHSDALAKQANEAAGCGANTAIHTFNAMRAFSHRETSMVSETLLNDGIYAEFICDLIHTNKHAASVLLRCKGEDKIILITDCMMAGGLTDGSYTLGEMKVKVVGKQALTEDGKLAGSVLKLNEAVRNMAFEVGAGKDAAVKMATINPAAALGIDKETGSIEVGKRADIIAVDDNFNVKFVMAGGVIKLSAE
ncbi:MAG: N-acetylglucosamine-6-phosphate deacetylase [Clostridiales bacterium]|jgi:N-acetylglucosamine-6-phosphate deacetylase|nr:N-acetylglucosamine-6-phosphate deacetylase [Clostridiales bacterium]